MQLLKRVAVVVLSVVPILAAAAYSCYPAFMAFWAMETVPAVDISKDEELPPARVLEIKREMQHHFLNHATYVPLADIVALPPGEPTADTALLMQKACGRGRLFIWIPFKFKLPLIGEKVFEWCWKPQIKDA